MTQQNAALVEQSAAAADSLRQQSASLDQVVKRFVLA
jgi:methyl-accepting chemotaxis protein